MDRIGCLFTRGLGDVLLNLIVEPPVGLDIQYLQIYPCSLPIYNGFSWLHYNENGHIHSPVLLAVLSVPILGRLLNMEISSCLFIMASENKLLEPKA